MQNAQEGFQHEAMDGGAESVNSHLKITQLIHNNLNIWRFVGEWE
jgi:hypothetical protein